MYFRGQNGSVYQYDVNSKEELQNSDLFLKKNDKVVKHGTQSIKQRLLNSKSRWVQRWVGQFSVQVRHGEIRENKQFLLLFKLSS